MKFLRLIPILFIFTGVFPYENFARAEVKNPRDYKVLSNTNEKLSIANVEYYLKIGDNSINFGSTVQFGGKDNAVYNVTKEDFLGGSWYLCMKPDSNINIPNSKMVYDFVTFSKHDTELEGATDEQRAVNYLKKYRRNVLTVPSNITLFNLWDQMMNKKEHIAIVIDEYGGLDGIVTMEDIIETLFGLEITDENDTIIDMQKYAKEKWKKKQNKKDILSRLS